MKTITWSEEKAIELLNKKGRGLLSFEICAKMIELGQFLDILNNPSQNHPHQKIYIIEFNAYIYYVPFVETDEEIFLKTIIPSRKLTAYYLAKRNLQ